MIGIAAFAIGFIISGAVFMLGYSVGRKHERQGWSRWIDSKIPRLGGERPWFVGSGN